MGTISLNAYLMFNGNCREAINFYQTVFGGTVNVMTFGQTDPNASDFIRDRIMHSDLMGGDAEFMACDTPVEGALSSGNINLALSGNDEERLTKMFEALSVGGTITVPLAKQMWGDVFGAIQDKFGIEWMVNISAKKE